MPSRIAHPQALDLMAAFARRHAAHQSVKTTAQVESATPPNDEQETAFSRQVQRLDAVHLRATTVRVHVLAVLEQCSPDCFDVSQIQQALHQRFGIVAPGSVYRALNEMTEAGLLVRRWGEHGRARYGGTPESAQTQRDTLACRCGKRLVFIEDQALHAQLKALANQEGFALAGDSVFAISTVCAGCKDGRSNMPARGRIRDVGEQPVMTMPGEPRRLDQTALCRTWTD